MSAPTGGQQWHLDRAALETGCSGWECGIVEVLGDPAVALIAIAAGLAVFVSFALLHEALGAVAEERKHVERERDAFDAFADRVARLQPEAPAAETAVEHQQTAAAIRIPTAGSSGGNAGIKGVESAYERTVMSMEHYDEEYGESLVENMAVELGGDVAAAVVGGDRLTPGLQNAVVSEARRAVKRREALLEQLDGEAERIEEARNAIEPLECRTAVVESDLRTATGFHEGTSAWNRFDAIESKLEAELERQQARLDPEEHPADEPHVFCTYLYGETNAEYPVLATVGELLERVERGKRRALETLAGSAPAD